MHCNINIRRIKIKTDFIGILFINEVMILVYEIFIELTMKQKCSLKSLISYNELAIPLLKK